MIILEKLAAIKISELQNMIGILNDEGLKSFGESKDKHRVTE